MPLVDIFFALSKPIPIIFEHLATHYQTLETWIGHNASRYPNLKALPHALPVALLYMFSKICLVLGNLQRATTRYCHIYKKVYTYYFFKKKIDGNVW